MNEFYDEFTGGLVYSLEIGENFAQLDVDTAKVLRDSLADFIIRAELVIE